MSELLVLDIGHGNAALVLHATGNVLVDAGKGDAVLSALEAEQVTSVRVALISHTDDDHLGGMISLLLDDSIVVEQIRINPDSTKETRTWAAFKQACGVAKTRCGTSVVPLLTSEISDAISTDGVRLEVLHPSNLFAMNGVGGTTLDGEHIDQNMMSAVVRIVLDGKPVAVLAADAGVVGLSEMIHASADAHAPVLVFPHHGGRPGTSSPAEIVSFASGLLDLVGPDAVVFSHGREKYSNPNPMVVEAILAKAPHVHVVCTQLSKHCSQETLLADDTHLVARFAAGRVRGHCCGGTIPLRPEPKGIALTQRDEHLKAISGIPGRLCRPDPAPPGAGSEPATSAR